jgi:hypothetical protein
MNDWEQFEAWIESRILERRATRREVYALRRLRRADTVRHRHQLLAAYLDAVVVDSLLPVFQTFTAQVEAVVQAMNELARVWAEGETEDFARLDLGEFDNRVHDWMRA